MKINNLEKILRFSKRLAFTSLVGIALIYGCSKDEEAPTSPSGNDLDAIEQQIVDKYYDWAAYSRSHNYNGMMNLVIPGSNMAGATNVCKSAWDEGNELNYAFYDVGIDGFDEDLPYYAYVWGNYTLYQYFGEPAEPSNGGFYGTAMPYDGEFYGDNWRLNSMNWNLEWDWWE